MSGICGGACAIRRLHELNSSAGAGTCRVTSGEGITTKQNAGCRSWESSSGIAVDVQQRLNCALPSLSLNFDSLSRFEVFTAYPQMINGFTCGFSRRPVLTLSIFRFNALTFQRITGRSLTP